ncbi:hypothetical protein [uncultured Clostridium sp.]|uniref:hypothetical protein n=1 Tax=uncultured Clostridium sp. TaxID=59620 RepID=UPI0025DDB2F4|nr:hypothetical protein [uncultured Clostridium sp.]
MKKVLNRNKLFYFTSVVLIIIVVLIIGVKFVKDFVIKDNKNVITKNNLDTLELYGYTLDDMDGKLYKEYFEELKSVLNGENVNYEDYAKDIVKLFVTDFYTLDTKLTSSDIGGVEFIPSNMIDNFKMNAGDTMYNHIKSNLYGDRKQDLPIVKSVNIDSINEINYTYKDKEYSGYKVRASWEYEKNMGYDKEGEYILIKDNNKLYIVSNVSGE